VLPFLHFRVSAILMSVIVRIHTLHVRVAPDAIRIIIGPVKILSPLQYVKLGEHIHTNTHTDKIGWLKKLKKLTENIRV
jgi:hypothetical protein